MNESLCFVRRKTLYPHRASLRPVVYMNRNGQKVWKASWNVLARIFPRGCHLSFQFLNSRKQSEWQKVVFLIFSPSPFSTLPWMSTKSHIIKLHKNEHNEQFLPFNFARGLLRETISNIVIEFGYNTLSLVEKACSIRVQNTELS